MTESALEIIATNNQTSEAAQAGEIAFDLDSSPSHLLHRAQQVAAELHTASFGATGFTQRQLAVLAVLGGGDAMSQTGLVAKTGIDRSTTAEMVARMEAKGLVVRVKSQTDSRAKEVSLTQMGRDALMTAVPKLEAIDKQVLSFLSANRRDALIDILTKIIAPEAGKSGKKASSAAKKPKKKDKKRKDKKKKVGKD